VLALAVLLTACGGAVESQTPASEQGPGGAVGGSWGLADAAADGKPDARKWKRADPEARLGSAAQA
jgi:hypothetical protein